MNKRIIFLALLLGAAQAGYSQRRASAPQPVVPVDTTTGVGPAASPVPESEPVPATVTALPPMVPAIPIEENNIVKSYYVELPYNKTVSIIFPVAVRSVDLGSRDIMADKAVDVENVLKLKATRNGFSETNFSVITVDGHFYSFVANFNEAPQILALNLTVGQSGPILRKPSSTAMLNGVDTRDGITPVHRRQCHPVGSGL